MATTKSKTSKSTNVELRETLSVVFLLLVAVVFLGVAIALFLSSLFQSVLIFSNLPLAYFITALVSLIIAGGMLWVGLLINRKA